MTTATEMANIPGIVVARHPEQTARILGTGIEVWEIIRTYIEVGHDYARLFASYHWLTERQILSAIEYARQHREAILERLTENYRFLPPGEQAPDLDF